MKRRLPQNTFLRYLISYIICLVFPIIILSFTFYNYFVSSYGAQLINKYTQSIDNTATIINNRINNINAIAQQLLIARELSDAFIFENSEVGSYYSINNLIRAYINTNDYIHDIWYYNKTYDIFYNSTQMLSEESFKLYGPKYKNISSAELVSMMENNKKPRWIGLSDVKIYGNTERLLSYIIAFSNSYVSEESVLFFQFKSSIISDILKVNIEWDNFTAAIMDEDKNMIYVSNPEGNPLLNGTMDEVNMDEAVTEVKRIENKKYYVHVKKYSDTGLSYLAVLPYKEFSGETQKFLIILIVIIILCILTGFVLIYLMMIYNYNPINNLLKYAKIQFNFDQKYVNEIDSIKTTMQSLADKNLDLQVYNLRYRQERMFFQLLKGSYSSKDHFERDFSLSNISLKGPYYRALIFSIKDNVVRLENDFEEVFKKEAEQLLDDVRFYFIEYFEINSYIVILSYNDDKEFNNKIEVFQESLKESLHTEIIIGVGQCYGELMEISKSYTEARWALRSQFDKNHAKVFMYSELDGSFEYKYVNLKLELKTLNETIVSQNTGRIDFMVSELINTVKNINTSYFYKDCLCYDIINTMFNAAYNAVGYNNSQPIIYEKGASNIDELMGIIQWLSEDIIDNLNKGKDYICEDNLLSILRYIDDNYTTPNFSIQMICDNFNISSSNLSHQFKARTGQNISLYINELKIKYAKHLLLTSDFSIDDIAQKIGYFQASGFIRKFKQSEGITPGEFRKMNPAFRK